MWSLLILLAGASASPSRDTRAAPNGTPLCFLAGTTQRQQQPQSKRVNPGGMLGTWQAPQGASDSFVAPGGTAVLKCCLDATETRLPLSIQWQRVGSPGNPCSLDPAASTNVTCGERTRLAWCPPCSILLLTDTIPKDSGYYECSVRLQPTVGADRDVGAGQGGWPHSQVFALSVMLRSLRNKGQGTDPPVYAFGNNETEMFKTLAGGCSALLMLLGVIVGWYRRYRYGSNDTPGTVPYVSAEPSTVLPLKELPLCAAWDYRGHQLSPPPYPAPPRAWP